MNKKIYILLILFTVVLVWLYGSLQNVSKARSREGIVLSPDASYSVEPSTGINIQSIFINYHQGFTVSGSAAAHGSFPEDALQIRWTATDSLEILLPQSAVLRDSAKQVYFFQDTIFVSYRRR